MPCVNMYIKVPIKGSYATVNAGLRNLMVHIMLCGGYPPGSFLVPKKAKKGWTIYVSMGRRLMRFHSSMFSQIRQDDEEYQGRNFISKSLTGTYARCPRRV